jgi:hypothetical protein
MKQHRGMLKALQWPRLIFVGGSTASSAGFCIHRQHSRRTAGELPRPQVEMKKKHIAQPSPQAYRPGRP